VGLTVTLTAKMVPVKAVRRGLHRLSLAWGLALLVLSPLLAHGHARLVRSSPANRAQVAEPPGRIELWFSELLEIGFNSVQVVRSAELATQHRTNLAQGAPTVDLDDRTHLVVPIPRLAPGSYAVEWRVLSRDGHSATGRFTFQIGTPE
jgi:methionine-rich copper-binding protein CopC